MKDWLESAKFKDHTQIGAELERVGFKKVWDANGSIHYDRGGVGDYEMQQIGSNTQYIHYISSDAGLVAMVVKDAGGFHYYSVFTDHLGSIVKVTDEYGTTIAEQNYDAWGRERDPDTWDYYTTSPPAKPDWLYRGYTGHEMLPEYGLINMNGVVFQMCG